MEYGMDTWNSIPFSGQMEYGMETWNSIPWNGNSQQISAFAAFSQNKAKILQRRMRKKKKAKQKEVKANPNEVKGSPNEVKANPNEVKGSPNEVKGQPKKVKGKRKKVKGKPSEVKVEPNVVKGEPNKVKSKRKKVSAKKAATNVTQPHGLQTPGKKIKKKGDFNNKDLFKSIFEAQNQILEAQNQSIFRNCAVINKLHNVFLKGESPEPEDEKGNKKLRKSIEDISKLQKTKKIKLMKGLDIENPETIEIVENQVPVNSVTSDVVIHDSFLGENFKPGKKRKMMNTECTKNSEVNKKLINIEPKIIIKNENEAANFSLLEEDTDCYRLNGESRLSKNLPNKSAIPQSVYTDSVKVGEEVFSWMLSPLSVKDFFKDCWEQKPLHIQHNDGNYFKDICTLDDFKKALRKHDMYFTRNIDVTSYIDGERHTENPEGKAKPSQVWDFYNNGRSIRLLNPQTFIQNVRVLNTTLQEFFHCFVGANIYLTPPGTQGFAPHYDDIEAFVLQLEGEKHWKLYNPRSPEEVLPRVSSRNFKEDEIGEPILEVTLQPGDLLYFPRGIIHQAKCSPHVHSLHITVSCYQRTAWADLMEKVIPAAIQTAISQDVEFRKGLPLGYLNSLGLIHSDKSSNLRRELIKKFEGLVRKIVDYCPLDAGVDQLGAGYVQDALPPCLSKVEELYGADRNCNMGDENFFEALNNSFDKNLGVKLIRQTCVRLVAEEEELWLYYTTDNSLIYHEYEASKVLISTQWAQALEYLIHSYPNFVEMKTLPVSLKINKPGKWNRIVDFVYFLWQKGLLLFDQPLRQICV